MRLILISLFTLALVGCFREAKHEEIAKERVASIVAIHYTVKHEEERVQKRLYGTVIDDHGLIMAQKVVPDVTPSERVQDIKIHLFGENSEGYEGEYIGMDDHTGFHYFRAASEAWSGMKSVFDCGSRVCREMMSVWGISSLEYDQEYYTPFFLKGMVGTVERSHVDMAICDAPVSSLGGPVFDEEGRFVGIVFDSLVMGYDMQLDGKVYAAALRKRRIGEIVLLASSLGDIALRDPEVELKERSAWLGVAGLQPLPNESLRHLGYSDSSALVVSQIFKESPGEEAGLEKGDIILGLDGEAFRFFPDKGSVISHLKLYIGKHKRPGDTLVLNILRNQEAMDVLVKLASSPKKDREMDREYFKRIGATFKDFSFIDSIRNKLYRLDEEGVVVQFVRPNGPSGDAGLRPYDWVKEIDGVVIESYEDAIEALTVIENDESIPSFVMLVERDNETQLLRIKID